MSGIQCVSFSVSIFTLAIDMLVPNSTFSDAICTDIDDDLITVYVEVQTARIYITEGNNLLEHVHTLLNASIVSGAFAAAIEAAVDSVTVSERRRLDVTDTHRRLSSAMTNASIDSVVTATFAPSLSPTSSPTPIPTAIPSRLPSTAPTLSPTLTPTSTAGPTRTPTYMPSTLYAPTTDVIVANAALIAGVFIAAAVIAGLCAFGVYKNGMHLSKVDGVSSWKKEANDPQGINDPAMKEVDDDRDKAPSCFYGESTNQGSLSNTSPAGVGIGTTSRDAKDDLFQKVTSNTYSDTREAEKVDDDALIPRVEEESVTPTYRQSGNAHQAAGGAVSPAAGAPRAVAGQVRIRPPHGAASPAAEAPHNGHDVDGICILTVEL